MKTILLAAAVALTATTGAFAQSSALDVYMPAPSQSGIDFSATASIGETMDYVERGRLGDGSPVYVNRDRGIDFTPTASIGGGNVDEPFRARLGDGSPVYN